LPDAKNGYAILTYHSGKFLIEGRCEIAEKIWAMTADRGYETNYDDDKD